MGTLGLPRHRDATQEALRIRVHRPLEDFERLPRRMNSVLLAVDGPHRRALPSQGWPKARWTTLDPAVEAGLVLPHVVAAREHRLSVGRQHDFAELFARFEMDERLCALA